MATWHVRGTGSRQYAAVWVRQQSRQQLATRQANKHAKNRDAEVQLILRVLEYISRRFAHGLIVLQNVVVQHWMSGSSLAAVVDGPAFELADGSKELLHARRPKHFKLLSAAGWRAESGGSHFLGQWAWGKICGMRLSSEKERSREIG